MKEIQKNVLRFLGCYYGSSGLWEEATIQDPEETYRHPRNSVVADMLQQRSDETDKQTYSWTETELMIEERLIDDDNDGW